MKQDFYLKTVLSIIAVCLVITTAKSINIIPVAKAGTFTHCKGSITVKGFGATQPLSGGYDVDVSCS